MIDGHPVVWLWLVTLMVALASDDVGVLPLAAHAAGLGIAGLATRGPRSASFLVGSAAALGAAAVWLGWWLLVPGATPSFWLRGALGATTVCLCLGLAAQLVRARGWLSLAALAGPAAPAFGWLACAGEALTEVASRRRQRQAVGLTAWLTAVRDLADGVPGVSPRHLLRLAPGDVLQAAAAAAITAALLLREAAGPLPLTLTACLLPLSLLAPRGIHA